MRCYVLEIKIECLSNLPKQNVTVAIIFHFVISLYICTILV